ncbi:hypothetical protein ACRBEV_10110 [Methylobacterium phyllosphaerae]
MTKSARRLRVYPEDSARPPETVRGGFLIACRDPKTGRLRKVGATPFEHGSVPEAEVEARRLAERYRQEFCVFREVTSVMPPEAPAAEAEPAEPKVADTPTPQVSSKPRTVIVERRVSRRQKSAGAT